MQPLEKTKAFFSWKQTLSFIVAIFYSYRVRFVNVFVIFLSLSSSVKGSHFKVKQEWLKAGSWLIE